MNQARSFPGLDLHLSLDILSFTDVMIRETGEPVKGVRFEIEVPEGESSFKNLPEHLALPTTSGFGAGYTQPPSIQKDEDPDPFNDPAMTMNGPINIMVGRRKTTATRALMRFDWAHGL